MSESEDIDQVQIKLKSDIFYKKFNKLNENSFISNNQSSYNAKKIQNPLTIDFEQYLRTQNNESVKLSSESLDYNESELQISEKNRQNKEKQRKRLIIQIGENYTFADQPSNRKRGNYDDFENFKLKFPQQREYLINKQNLKKLRKQNHLHFKNSNKPLSNSQPQHFSSSTQKQLSLSDNQEQAYGILFKQKEIQEQMFIKIAEKTKQILTLKEKNYYFEDLSKRLLISNEEKNKCIQNLQNSYKEAKKNLKAKNKQNKLLQATLKEKEKELFDMKSHHLIQKNFISLSKPQNISSSYNNLTPTSSHKRKISNYYAKKSPSQQQRKILLEKENNILKNEKMENTKFWIQKQKQLEKKFKMLLVEKDMKLKETQDKNRELCLKYERLELSLMDTQRKFKQSSQQNIKYQIQNSELNYQNRLLYQQTQTLKSQIQSLQLQIQSTQSKSKNQLNMNKILQKQISSLNMKILELQKQIEQVTYKKCIKNFTRIKNLSTQGNELLMMAGYNDQDCYQNDGNEGGVCNNGGGAMTNKYRNSLPNQTKKLNSNINKYRQNDENEKIPRLKSQINQRQKNNTLKGNMLLNTRK